MIWDEPTIVRGEQCLDYINKPIGFASVRGFPDSEYIDNQVGATALIGGVDGKPYIHASNVVNATILHHVPHDTSKRVCGLVLANYSDGGKLVAILGNEPLYLNKANGYMVSWVNNVCEFNAIYDEPSYGHFQVEAGFQMNPTFVEVPVALPNNVNGSQCFIYDNIVRQGYTFSDSLDLNPYMHLANFDDVGNIGNSFKYQGNDFNRAYDFILTTDPENTLTFGENALIEMGGILRLYGANTSKDPLALISGNIYDYFRLVVNELYYLLPSEASSSAEIQQVHIPVGASVPSFNGICLPYNLVLTNDLQYAQAYVSDGVLPPDAYLYPLDWDNLPKYDTQVDPDNPSDDPPDDPDDNDPDDDSWDIDDDPPTPPANTSFTLSNYNWYWLTSYEYEQFINWFWHDIGDYNDFDDIIAKIKGLYNDVASAVLMVRYMPVNPTWLGGLGGQENIKVGMIEREGLVTTLSGNTPPLIHVGDKLISSRYKSFVDYSPYTQLSLYLPYHGFLDLDINIFMGNYVRVYATYDVISGTIQYFIYCLQSGVNAKKFIVNTVIAKMAVDIPITLQTKNDRDSAVFQNVSSAVGGLIGAGAGIMSGNPMGVAIGVTQGVQSLTSTNASAPLNVKGTMGENGSLYAPNRCRIVLRRPTIQASDTGDNKKGTWLKHVGRTACYGYTLGSEKMTGSGLNICENPRITFKNTTPLQTEVDEIYDILSKGVIL